MLAHRLLIDCKCEKGQPSCDCWTICKQSSCTGTSFFCPFADFSRCMYTSRNLSLLGERTDWTQRRLRSSPYWGLSVLCSQRDNAEQNILQSTVFWQCHPRGHSIPHATHPHSGTQRFWQDGRQWRNLIKAEADHYNVKTIIECLKYATTGDLPPNSKGGAFIHDPKVRIYLESLWIQLIPASYVARKR